ncbi:MAG: carboxylesterase family protein [Chitinophagales bacterium]|nr:carboxylesterase family protein [Chitinophagales bacterium]
MKQFLLTAFALFLFTLNTQAQCPPGRYYDKIYGAKTNTAVLYGSNKNYLGNQQSLYMDIYEPQGDNFARRPLIILAFGGSFTSGVRQSPDMLVLCDEFAKRGYVTATIDYRIGKENGDDTAMYKAVIRGLQDMNAAIRFFYKDVYTQNKYRIDTTQIFVGGTSAGGFIGLNSVYYIPLFSRPTNDDLLNTLVDMGGMLNGSGNEGYSNKVKGVVNLSGGILDTIWIQPNSPILVSVHGTADETVPFYYDSIKGITDIKARFFGSGDIAVRCANIGHNCATRPFYGADHVPFVLPSTPYLPPSKQYMDSTIWFLRDFLSANTVCDPALVSVQETELPLPLSVLPTYSDDLIQVFSHHDKPVLVNIYRLDGKLLLSERLNPEQVLNLRKEKTGAGLFVLEMLDAENHAYKRTEKVVFY